jgi:hypothetical protein
MSDFIREDLHARERARPASGVMRHADAVLGRKSGEARSPQSRRLQPARNIRVAIVSDRRCRVEQGRGCPPTAGAFLREERPFTCIRARGRQPSVPLHGHGAGRPVGRGSSPPPRLLLRQTGFARPVRAGSMSSAEAPPARAPRLWAVPSCDSPPRRQRKGCVALSRRPCREAALVVDRPSSRS